MSGLNISREQALTVRGLIRGEIRTRNAERFPASNAWFASCHHEPKRLDRILACLNECLGLHGVEAIWGEDIYWPSADYLNTGDTYATTIVFCRETSRFLLSSWGDYFERNEKRYSLR